MKNFNILEQNLEGIGEGKMLINTINAYSYNLTLKDKKFEAALKFCDVLIPDGVAVVWAKKILERKKIKKIAGADLFYFYMNQLQNNGGGKVFFLGSSVDTLQKIKARAAIEYPKIEVHSYSPPYKPEFNTDDNRAMLYAVNNVEPDVLFVGMTAPKQEKWAYEHFRNLKTGPICCIGAVFDFYARTVKRAPQWMIDLGLEWFYRLLKEPKRMAYRYLIGNPRFVKHILQQKFTGNNKIPYYPYSKIVYEKSKASMHTQENIKSETERRKPKTGDGKLELKK